MRAMGKGPGISELPLKREEEEEGFMHTEFLGKKTGLMASPFL